MSLRHDHGSQYTSRYFGVELKFLGIHSSPSFVAEPECNGVSERFVRTLKEQLLWQQTFETIEELRLALIDFKHRYNNGWLVQKHGQTTTGSTEAHNPRGSGCLNTNPCLFTKQGCTTRVCCGSRLAIAIF